MPKDIKVTKDPIVDTKAFEERVQRMKNIEGGEILLQKNDIDTRNVMRNIVKGYPDANKMRNLLRAREWYTPQRNRTGIKKELTDFLKHD